MSNFNKMLTILEENQLNVEMETAYWNIRHWYAEQLSRHKAELPKEEMAVAREHLMAFMRKATVAYNAKDPIVIQYWKETLWFILPWRVTLWYSFNKKKVI